MIKPALRLLLPLLLLFPASRAAAGEAGAAQPPPSCSDEYSRAADPYWPMIGDMVRLNAMFENYKAICARADPEQFKAVKPLADRLGRSVKADMARSYDVMADIIRNRLDRSVPPRCRKDGKARDEAVDRFHAAMDDQAKKARKRLSRSAGSYDGSDTLCHNLTGLRAQYEQKTKGRDPEHPLYTLALLRGRMTGQSGALKTYVVYGQSLRDLGKSDDAAAK